VSRLLDFYLNGEGWGWLALFLLSAILGLALLWLLIWWLPMRRRPWHTRDAYMHLLGAIVFAAIIVLGLIFDSKGPLQP
jgi:hypothetical protein